MNMYSCSKCHKPITERTVSICDNRYWHSACLNCHICGVHPQPIPGQSLYVYRGSLVCKNDYIKLQCVCKCCQRPIGERDMVIRAKNFGYLHDKCVVCRQCSTRLYPGDRYWWTTDNMLVCQKCLSASGNGTMINGPTNSNNQSQMMSGQQQMGTNNQMSGPMTMDYGHMGPGGQAGNHMIGPSGAGRMNPAMNQQHSNQYMNPGNGGQMMPIKMEPNGMPPNQQSTMGGIKMEPNGYGNGNANGINSHGGPQQHHNPHSGYYGSGATPQHHHHQHGQPQHMNHHPPQSRTPGTHTPTPPPTAPPPTTTTGRRGRKKQNPQL